MFRLFGLLLVGLVLSGIAGSGAAWADTINCKRTSNSSAGFTTSSAFDSWFPKQLSLNTYDWGKIKGQKSVKKKDGQRIYQLLPNGKMIASMENRSGYQTVSNIRYKCDKTAIQIASGNTGGSTAVASNKRIANSTDGYVCSSATKKLGGMAGEIIWDSNYTDWIDEAKRRGLDCDVGNKLATYSDKALCTNIKLYQNPKAEIEAKRRGLSCGVVDTAKTGMSIYPDEIICTNATSQISGSPTMWFTDSSSQSWVQEAKRRGLSCGVGEASTTQTASSTTTTPSNTTTSAELTASQKEAERLRQELAALKAEQEQQQQTISNDNQTPLITATSRRDSQTNAVISGQVTDNVAVAEVTIDGEAVRLGNDGSFTTSFYVPRSGKTVEIIAFDKKGNKATKSLFIERGEVRQATGPVFASLNPSVKRVKSNKDALALIVGIADYERTPAKAAYADKDAQTFYDYAMLKLGIPAGNIKELVNVKAGRVDVSLAIKDFIARSTKQGQSDIYVFFAGHGLANQSGEEMYLLPYDGSPRLLEDSAISRERLFADISAANPRSVTVFLDTCYSGTTRGTDMLIASRPIAIRALEQSIPDNFTVMTAAAGDQTAKPLEEAKHGMFSYFLMKGMEGEADTNNDNEITAGELHSYVQTNVIQQSSGSQTPELQGDADRVLVRFQ
jgi:hypothetical protein